MTDQTAQAGRRSRITGVQLAEAIAAVGLTASYTAAIVASTRPPRWHDA